MPQGLPRAVHQDPHAGDAVGQAYEHRLSHEVMADIELDDFGNRGDRDNIIVIEPVAGMHLEAGSCRCPGAVDEAPKLAPKHRIIACERRRTLFARVELDGIGPNLPRGFDLLKLGVDEERDLNAAAP